MNNKFNLELAKCGGVVKVINLYSPVHDVFYAKLVEPVGDWGYFAKCHGHRFTSSDCLLFSAGYYTSDDETLEDYNVLGMATRDECEKAGVEYIEPPLSQKELDALRKENSSLKAKDEELNRLLHKAISNIKKG